MNLSEQQIILENEIVKFKPLQFEKHSKAFFAFAIQEPTTWQYSLISPAGSTSEMEKYINDALTDLQKNTTYPFVVIDKATNAIVGCTRFYDIDFKNECLTIGYTWYGEKFRRTGINRNCKLLLLEYAFTVLQMERVEFRADASNTASVNAMKAIGCVEEGVLRSHLALPNGKRRTSMVLSILKMDWENGGREFLQSKIK